MSRNGQTPMPPDDGAMVLGEWDLPGGTWFPWHAHDQHQLAWAASGVAIVNVGDAHWILPPSTALWLPAGTPHRTGASGRTVLRGVYADPGQCPIGWRQPQLVRVSPLLRELLEHLTNTSLEAGARSRAEAVVFDLLEPVSIAPIVVPMPTDTRARRVASALLADPADARDLAALGQQVGASSRTLARIFTAQSGLSFGRWRTRVRLRASLPLLAEGMSLDAVADRVGYSSASAFVASFRKTVGVSPGAYFGAARSPSVASVGVAIASFARNWHPPSPETVHRHHDP